MSPPKPSARRFGAEDLRRLAGRLNGARLSYGKPVRAGERTIIPVARVHLVGGFGYGSADGGETADGSTGPGAGGGGGGSLEARPMGFIESGPEGTRYQPIRERGRRRVGGLLVAGAAGTITGATVAGTTAGALVLRRAARSLRPTARSRGARPRLRAGPASRSPRRWLPR